MYEYRGLEDIFFMMLYGGVALFTVVACLYLLLMRGNTFVGEEWLVSLRKRNNY